MMKTSSLLQQISIALLLTLLAAINDFILRQFFTGLLSAKVNIALIVFLYLAYLIWQNRIAAGRITLLLIDLSVLLICLFTSLSTISLLIICLFLIWLNRLLLCYSSVLSILADLGLCLLSACVVYWLLFNGHGLITALWSLLLLQSLHCLIADKKMASKPQESSSDNFDHALQSAESALQQLLK